MAGHGMLHRYPEKPSMLKLLELFASSRDISNASKLLKQQCGTLAKQSGKSNISIYSKLLKFQASSKFRVPDRQTACLPAVRPDSNRCRPPNFSQVAYSRV